MRSPAETRSGLAQVAALALAPAIGLGVARFAYALILPDMRADLGWSYQDAGMMNTTNAAGYLLGALFAPRAIAAWGALRVLSGGVWACVASLALCALFRDFVLLNAARTLAGVGGGLSLVAGGLMAAQAAQRDPRRDTFLLGLFYAGPGLGILLSGAVAPFVLSGAGPGSWRWAWATLAVMTALLACGLPLARDAAQARPAPATRLRVAEMRRLLSAYLMFGVGYIAYMTFMVAWVRRGAHGPGFQALFWGVLGLAAMASPWVSAAPLKGLRHGRAFALQTALTAAGAALPLLSDTVPAMLASAALFGAAFFAVVAATTVFVRRNLAPAQWPGGIGALTVAFSVGQILGPIATGYLNDRSGGLAGGLWASVAVLALAAATGWTQRDFGGA